MRHQRLNFSLLAHETPRIALTHCSTCYQIFAAALSGVPLSALSFSYGMVTALGSEASALMLLSRFVLLASLCKCLHRGSSQLIPFLL